MNQPQTIVVMLDALIDTRVGTAVSLKATDIDWEAYRDRMHSMVWEFFKLDKVVYQRAYARRDADVLKKSVATVLFSQIEAIAARKIIASKSNPLLADLEVQVNYWPFKLSRHIIAELHECFKQAFSPTSNVTVTMINKHPRELDPKYLRSLNADLIVYDLTEWFTYNNTKFEECPIPDLSIVYPATLNTEDISKYSPSDNHDPFADLALHLSPVVKLETINPTLLSLDLGLLLRDAPRE